MKKLTICFQLFLLVLVFLSRYTCAQSVGKLYVTMAHRLSGPGGTLISINTDGTGYSKLYSFDPPGGFQPQGGVILGADGKLYGTTAGGGSNTYGIIYSINIDGTGYGEVHGFGAPRADGVSPFSTMLKGNDGKLYGTTNAGGLETNQGTVFSIGADGNSFSKLLSFDGSNGVSPYYVPLIRGADGLIYGITAGGGVNQYYGVIYSIHTDGTGFTKLHDFAGLDGNNPFSLLQATDGKLYGSTHSGGPTRSGNIFSINTDGTGFSSLYALNFARGDGEGPYALIQGTDGKLYGTTEGGGGPGNDGVLFSVSTDGSDFKTLYLFDRATSGRVPYSIIQGPDGKIYGVTQFGGRAADGGTVYSINTDGSDFQKLMDCTDSTGMFPTGILFLESTNNQEKISQTIAFDSIAAKTQSSGNFMITAIASSGLPVSFHSSDSTIAMISGDTVTMLQTGSVIITASQAGDAAYYPATPVQQELIIGGQPPAIDAPHGNCESPPGILVKTFPNPFGDHFSVQLISDHQQEVEVTVVDFTGRVLDQGPLRTDELIEFGNGYKPGLYIVQLSYGDKRKTMKLFKLE